MDGRRGFTLVELVFVVGILAVVVGLLLPSLESVVVNARRTRAMAQTRQNMLLIDLYASDHNDGYPLASTTNIIAAQRDWYQVLIESGTVNSIGDLDYYKDGWFGPTSYAISMALVRKPDEMIPGNVAPLGGSSPHTIRRGDVLFASQKGAVFQYALPYVSLRGGRGSQITSNPESSAVGWCCAAFAPPAPIGFCDQSVGIYTWVELMPSPRVIENGVGYPVESTWLGCRGIDRR